MKFTVVNPSGKIASVLDVPSREIAEMNLSDGQRLVDGEYEAKTHYFDGDTLTPFPDNPGDWAEFDFDLKVWVDPRTTEDLMQAIRIQRDALLLESDWTQLPDNPLTEDQMAAWKEYRQELRDLPEKCDDPVNPVFPDRPI